MNRREKKFLYDIFYTKYKMLDKLNYIKKVMSSCKTVKQLDIAYEWGKKTIWIWFDAMNKELDTCRMWSFCYNRTCGLSDDLLKTHAQLYNELTRVVV